MTAADAADLVQQGFDSKFNSTAATWVQPYPTNNPDLIFPTAHLPAFLANLINFHYEGRDRSWYRNKYLYPDGKEKPIPTRTNLTKSQILATYGKYWDEVGHQWNLRYALSTFSDQDQMLALQSWKYCTMMNYTIAASDPYYTGVTVAQLDRKKHHGALFSIADGRDTAPITGKDGAEYTFTEVEMESLTSAQVQEVSTMSSLLHMDAQAQGEQEVPLLRKRSRASVSTATTNLPQWPAPPTTDGYGFDDEGCSVDPAPALKRRKTIPKPAAPTYLLDGLLYDGKSLEVCHSAETLLLRTLAIQANPSVLEPTVPKFLTPTSLPQPSANYPTIIIPKIPELTPPEPSAKPFNIYDFLPLPQRNPPTLDTDSDCDQEFIPPHPASPIDISTSPEPSPIHPTSDPTVPSSSNQAYRGVPSMPFPIGLESKFDHALGMLDKISRQLSDLHTQQQAGFAEQLLRHDTNEINLDAVALSSETTAVTSSRIMLGEVRKIFTRGTPRHRTESDDAAWRRRMTMEVHDARRVAEAAVQGERNMRALNVRLYQEINDLRRQLNQETYLNVPLDRHIAGENRAEEGNNQRMDEAAAREADRHETEQERLNRLRGAMYLSD